MMRTDTMDYVAPHSGFKSRLLAARALLERAPFSVVQLACRLAIAGVFLRAGLQKLSGWETTLALFANEYKVPLLSPEIAAAVAAFTEVGCSILLIAGLATRLATLPFLGMIAVIQTFVYPEAWPEHLVWASILLVLLARGGGAVSLDRLIARWVGARRV